MSTCLSPNHPIYLYTNLNTLHTWHHQPTDISLQTPTLDCSQYQHLTLAAITSRSPSRYRMWRAFSLRPFTLSVSPLPTYISTVSCPGKFSHQPVHTHAPHCYWLVSLHILVAIPYIGCSRSIQPSFNAYLSA